MFLISRYIIMSFRKKLVIAACLSYSFYAYPAARVQTDRVKYQSTPEIQRTNGGTWILNTETGAVSYCYLSSSRKKRVDCTPWRKSPASTSAYYGPND